jgi:hypothetical protein
MPIANTSSTTTVKNVRLKLNEVIGVVNTLDGASNKLINGAYNLTLQANSALRLPSGAKLISGYPGFGQYLSNFATLAGEYVYLSSANGYSYIGYENSTITLAHGPNIWSFDIDGTIRFPDNTIQSTAYTGSAAYLQVSNANAKFATKAYAASNAAIRLLISDRIQVANVSATYQTKAVERAALANTNAYIATRATWSALTGTNTALRILINDRIQLANVAAKYATKAYAASNAYVKLLLANTNAYIADVAASSGGGGGGFSAEALDYGLITSSVDVELNRDYGTL